MNPSRETKFSGTHGDRVIPVFIFPVQLTTSMIDNLTRLVHAVYRRLLSQVLSALKILGRGNFFDDLCEWSYMSEPTIQASFHQFCKYFAEEFYEEHIFLPTGTMQTKVMEDFHKVEFTGAVGSTDVTHIRWDCCVYSLVRSYTGKEGFPTIAYQVTVDHSGRALAVTRGFAGAHNDKTIIRYDDAVQQIRKNATYTERVFHLRGKDGELIDCKGNYLIVDNGYHKVRSLRSLRHQGCCRFAEILCFPFSVRTVSVRFSFYALALFWIWLCICRLSFGGGSSCCGVSFLSPCALLITVPVYNQIP